MRDRLLVGLYNDNIQVKVLEVCNNRSNLSLADLILLVKRYENAKTTGRKSSNELNAVSAYKKGKMAQRSNGRRQTIVCRKCNITGHLDINCENKNAKCTFCCTNTQFTNQCRNKKAYEEQLKKKTEIALQHHQQCQQEEPIPLRQKK